MPSSRPGHPYQAATLVTAMGLYFAGAPAVSFILGSWWPMILGAGGLAGIVCLLLAINIFLDARKPTTLADFVDHAILSGLIDYAENQNPEERRT